MYNMDPMNTTGYNQNNWSRPNYGFSTNIIYVTSLEEALSRSNIRNSENVYFHQDQPLFYRIKVDQDGRKYWQEFSYDVPKPAENAAPATKADLTSIIERIKKLEAIVIPEREKVTVSE